MPPPVLAGAWGAGTGGPTWIPGPDALGVVGCVAVPTVGVVAAGSTTLLWLSVSEVGAIIDGFDALEIVHGLTLDERVLRDDLVDWIGGSGVL